MKILILQHAEHEDEGVIKEWASKNGHDTARVLLYRGDELPGIDSFDFLLVMGGPMGVYDENEFPFLAAEKRFIGKAVKRGKKIAGICLGAQLLAAVLGAEVKKNSETEIGWFGVSMEPQAGNIAFLKNLPRRFVSFHWHGDTFGIPEGAVRLAANEACGNQAFLYGRSVLALQFHLEMTPGNIDSWLAEFQAGHGRFVQEPEAIRKGNIYCNAMNGLLFSILDGFLRY